MSRSCSRCSPTIRPAGSWQPELHVSEITIKTHLTAIRHKLGAPGRPDLVARARELGLLEEDALPRPVDR